MPDSQPPPPLTRLQTWLCFVPALWIDAMVCYHLEFSGDHLVWTLTWIASPILLVILFISMVRIFTQYSYQRLSYFAAVVMVPAFVLSLWYALRLALVLFPPAHMG